MRILRFLLLFLLVIPSSITPLVAQEGRIIREILVVGNTRTSEQVIRSQLPFTEGDLWQDDFQQWAIWRFTTLDIFAYEPMRIIAEPLSEHECRVLVRLADPSIFYKDAGEYFVMTGMRLLNRQLNLTIYNPIGTGQNLNLDIIWGENYSYGGSFTSVLGPGTATLSGRYYRRDHTFSHTAYESSGWSIEGAYRYWWNKSLRQTARIQYHSFELDSQKSDFIIPGLALGIYASDRLNAGVSSAAGFALQDEPYFWRLQGELFAQQGPVIGLVRGGYTSPSTPANLQFATGGFSSLPLRGENPWHLTRAYAIGTVEYHFCLGKLLTPIVFADGGWIWNDNPPPGLESFLINAGLGIAFYTPLGIPVRIDFAVNPAVLSWGWKLEFGHTFIPLF